MEKSFYIGDIAILNTLLHLKDLLQVLFMYINHNLVPQFRNERLTNIRLLCIMIFEIK